MNDYYNRFHQYLDDADRFNCVDLVLRTLSNKDIDIATLYEEILVPSLREHFCRDNQREICIWEEHVRSSIVRTVIECCYPFVIKERDGKHATGSKGKVIVLCPTEELHEIGARMVADFFTLCGYDAVFIGANTPQVDILDAISYVRPKIVAISVTSYYNLLAARRTIQKIRQERDKVKADFRIVAGGLAFEKNPRACEEAGVDMVLQTFAEIKKLSESD